MPVVVWEEPHERSIFRVRSQYARARTRALAGRKTGVAGKWTASIALAHRSPLPRDHPVPAKARAAAVNRLAGILRNGLLAPASCPDGSVCSDLNLVVTGTPVPYDSLVFLHRFGPDSFIYTISEPGRFSVFVNPSIPVLTPEEMGDCWVLLCQDEVYVRGRVRRRN